MKAAALFPLSAGARHGRPARFWHRIADYDSWVISHIGAIASFGTYVRQRGLQASTMGTPGQIFRINPLGVVGSSHVGGM